jgi:hypothetical protein
LRYNASLLGKTRKYFQFKVGGAFILGSRQHFM